jgi:hypothetical protein
MERILYSYIIKHKGSRKRLLQEYFLILHRSRAAIWSWSQSDAEEITGKLTHILIFICIYHVLSYSSLRATYLLTAHFGNNIRQTLDRCGHVTIKIRLLSNGQKCNWLHLTSNETVVFTHSLTCSAILAQSSCWLEILVFNRSPVQSQSSLWMFASPWYYIPSWL